jgi:2-polyprenyl-3-methyl-5-hydroxy-6-metoxy-1,4-benzoquinol methylase
MSANARPEPMLTLVDAPCPACGSTAHHEGRPPARMSAPFQPYADQLARVRIIRCADCTARYVAPMVQYSDAFRRALYGIGYWDAGRGTVDHKNLGEKRGLLDRVASVIGPLRGKSLLDIGCGTGEYLDVAARRGMLVRGIDVDQSVADYIRDHYGHRVTVGLMEDTTFPPDSFDVIVLSHVVEHLQEPATLLRSIHRALKPGGVFLMSTPNFDSVMEQLHDWYGQWKHGKGKDYYLNPFTIPYHIVGFNRRSITRLLERTGFQPVYVNVHSGLEWENSRTSFPVFVVYCLGALLRRGTALNTISRKAPPVAWERIPLASELDLHTYIDHRSQTP